MVEKELANILEEYITELGDEAQIIFKEVGKETALGLQADSESKLKGTGKYAKGWASRMTGRGLQTSVTIYNKTQPSLTYLLENGHMILLRGHNYGRSRAIKHIKPAEEKATVKLLERLTRT